MSIDLVAVDLSQTGKRLQSHLFDDLGQTVENF